LGHVPGSQLPAVYTAAQALVWPSLFEGFGLPPLEAMACGTPALTSNTSSLPEVAGDAAVLVNPHDTDTIAEGMLNIVQNEAFRKDLRARGIVRAKQFTWDRAAELTIQTYRRALGL
jgi:glycosyltransferase involved in cell wall biosynthesis